MKNMNMKLLQNLSRSIFLGCITVGTLGLLAPTLTLADGKGASNLMFAPPIASTVQAGSSGKMAVSCPRCNDGLTKVVDASAKGMRAQSVKTVATHLCPECRTKIVSVGAGKAKIDQVAHSCGATSAAASSCCIAGK
jgi:hypothetical protein